VSLYFPWEGTTVGGSADCSYGSDSAHLTITGSATSDLRCTNGTQVSYRGALTAKRPDGKTAFVTDYVAETRDELGVHEAVSGVRPNRRFVLELGDNLSGPASYEVDFSWYGGIGFGRPLSVSACSSDSYTTIHGVEVTAEALVPTAAPPVSSAPPHVSGTAKVGQTLTTDDGVWIGNVTSYDYQWQRCDASGVPCSDIQGAWARSYVATDADAGHALRASVTACNLNGCGIAASSDPTAPVAPR
jgi:hypothetical protein